MLSPSSLTIIDSFWRQHFGCTEGADLFTTPPQVLGHAGDLTGYEGVFALYRATGGSIISVPPPRMAQVAALLPEWETSLGSFADLFPVELRKAVVGPAFIGYTLSDPPCHGETRLLSPEDGPRIGILQAACDTTGWDHGGTSLGECTAAAGSFKDGTLVALAGYKVWGGHLAHISIVTHPLHRGKGYGRQAVALLTGHALSQKLIPQYRTLESNAASVAIARALGFEHYGSSIAIRLHPEP